MHLGILAVVPILVQWLLSSYTQTYSRKGRGSGGYEDAYNVNHLPPKSHWTLLAELQQVPEEDMELLLPQVLNILLDRDALQDSDELFMQFERILLFKCANSLPFGMRLSCLLKASAGAASERLFRNVLLSNSQQSQRREDRIRRLQERVETVSAQGMGLDANMRTLRINYFEDCKFLLDNFSRIGLELKSYPVKFRKRHLMNALRQCNSFIFHRMISKVNLPQPASQTQQHHPPGNREHRTAYNGHSYASHHSAPHYSEDVQRSHETDYFQSETTELSNMSPQEVAKLCPAAAFHSLHLPIQHSNDLTLRILRIVEEECEVLPSKERCPYLVVVEVMEQPYPVHSFLLYAHGFEAMKEIAGARLRAATATAGTSQPIGAANPEYAKSQDIRKTQQENRGDIDTEFSHSEESIAREVLLASSAAAASRANSPRQDVFVGDEYFNDPAAGKQNENVRDFARPDFGTPPRSYDSTHNPYDSNESGKEYSDPYAGLHDNTTPSSAPTQHKHSFTEQYSDDTRWSEGRPSDQSTSYCEPTVLAHPPFSQTGYSHRQTTVEEETQLCYPSPYPHPYPGPSDAYDYSQYRLQSSDECSYEGRGHGVVPVRKKTWIERREIVRSMSPFGQLEGWGLKAFIVKSGDDLRKEVLAMQLIEYCQKVFHSEGLDIFLRPYQIISTGRDCGLVEFIENAQSLDKIKKAYRPYASSRDASLNLRDYFEHSFGPGYSLVYSKALHNFVSSLVGYSLLTYLLQVKDRHNANIMIDSDGHIVHIDYGFIFGDSPGFNINFESAPFKFTGEYADVMGGLDSEAFRTFEDMFLRGFAALQRHAEGLSAIVELFYGEKKKSSAESLRTRLLFPASASDILGLIRDSLDNWRTKQYDWYQKKTNNIEI